MSHVCSEKMLDRDETKKYRLVTASEEVGLLRMVLTPELNILPELLSIQS